MMWPANSSCFPWNNASQQGFTPKAKHPVSIIPADGVGTQYGPRSLPCGFPQDIHTFPKAACTYTDSEDNCPCKKGPLWSLMVSHVVLTHRLRYRDSENSHSWPALRDRAGPLGWWSAYCLSRTAGSHPRPALLRRAAPEAASSLAAQGFSEPSPTSLWEPQGVRKLLRDPDPQPAATRRYCSPRAAKSESCLLPLFPRALTLKTARQAKSHSGRYRGCY